MQGKGKNASLGAMGTLAVMQDGNSRTDLNISDFRYSHTRLGRIITADYARYGVREDLLSTFGEKAELIQKALDAIKAKQIGLPVYSSSASVNREVEKQNSFILVNLMRQHYMGIAQLIGQSQAMTTPPDVKEYLAKVIAASNRIMKTVLRDFDKEDVDELIPDVEQHSEQQANPQQTGQSPAQPSGPSSVVPISGGGGISSLLQQLSAGGKG